MNAATALRGGQFGLQHVLLRTVYCVQGTVELHLDCEPSFDYGRAGAQWEYTGEGYNQAVATAEGLDVRWTGSKKLTVCFECRTAPEGQRLVKDISARPELAPYQIDFCVLVK